MKTLRPPAAQTLRLPAAADFGLREFRSASGLVAQLLPNGALFALRHGETLLNQLLPGPAEEGLFRLLGRVCDAAGIPLRTVALVGPRAEFHAKAAAWRAEIAPGVTSHTTLQVHPESAAWSWRVRLDNRSPEAISVDVLHAQDLGLGDEAAVRNNEAYVSQYLDLLPVHDAALGHVVLARQNQPMAGGCRPWAGFACDRGAVGYCTDGEQFFGVDHRLTGAPRAAREARLPSTRLQYEFAMAGLQSPLITIAAGGVETVTFVGCFVPDHPEASSPADVARLRDALSGDWPTAEVANEFWGAANSLFVQAPWLHGDAPSEADLAAWFPGEHRHLERDAAGRTLSFFCEAATHVVTREKEAAIARPHGHILRSGAPEWNDAAQFGVTCYAAGVFGAQAYLGNCSTARLLSVVRNHLGLGRASGQRLFVRRHGKWMQLGVPSVFALKPGSVSWIYRWGDEVLCVRAWAAAQQPASFLEVQVLAGPAREFLFTHQIALGANEFGTTGELTLQAHDAWVGARFDSASFTGRHLPETAFAIALTEPSALAAIGAGARRDEAVGVGGGPYVTLRTHATTSVGVILLGVQEHESLAGAVAQARSAATAHESAAHPPSAPVRLQGAADAGVARIDEILPWFTHNAAIHFSAPHGLEQYGGAAWGVRDVCQGSVEWLLAAGEFATVRRILLAVFAQQYATGDVGSVAGGWPQWFMFDPFRAIQQAHSHGDVCFWPVKALCDYIEASNDFAVLDAKVAYTDSATFKPTGPEESLWQHCDRVVALVVARFVPNTALVNYGDGDWDDTLQPADPVLRTRMVSAWTVGLAFQTFRQLAVIAQRAGEAARAGRLGALIERMRADFNTHLIRDGVVAGFLVNEPNGEARPLLHPSDRVTGIRYRLLPMTRAMLAELFTPEQAEAHREIVARELKFADGVRLMSEPARYRGGLEQIFKRAETAANVGREIGLQYVHAHLRYAEAMAKLGRAGDLWEALQVVNPVGIERVVPRAAPRQSNVYFSSSDADFPHRLEAEARWPELKAGRVAVRAGWRLYSSGPGLYLHKVRSCLVGVRESFGEVEFDPVLPRALDGLCAETRLAGRVVQVRFAVRSGEHTPRSLRVNGVPVAFRLGANPYRTGGARVSAAALEAHFLPETNVIDIEL